MKKVLRLMAFLAVRAIGFTTVAISFSIQAQDMAIRSYTAKDGLSSTYVWGSYQDKLGYLWVGSPNGLSRFDGKYFTNYGLPDGLPDTRVTGGFMDSHLRYWALSESGAAEFNGKKFITYPVSDSQNVRWVFQITETKQGNIWISTNVGIYQFNQNKWTKVSLFPGYDDHICRGIAESNDGLFINYGNLLVLKKPGGQYEVAGKFNKIGYYYNILLLSQDDILVSTLDSLCIFREGRLKKMPGTLGRIHGVYIFFRDSKNRFWIGNEKIGLRLFNAGDTTNFKQIYKSYPYPLIHHITEDRQGNIWVSSSSGLLKFSEPGFKIFNVPITKGGKIWNVIQPPSGPLLINDGSLKLQTFENGVFGKKKLQVKGIPPRPNNEFIIDDYAFDNKNRNWYFLRGSILAIQEGNNIYEQRSRLAPFTDHAFDVLYDSVRKKIIMALHNQQFPFQFDDTGYRILPVVNKIPVTGNIIQLHQCANGTLLFATEYGKIYSINLQNTCTLQLNEFGTEGLVSRFFNDPSGDVWIIYNGRGLRRYSWHKGTLVFAEALTRKNGLLTDNLRSVCFDSTGNLWVCSNSDVAVFSKHTDDSGNQSYQINNFFDAGDLQLTESNGTWITKDLKQNIWLFSGTKLICFFPDKITHTITKSTIQIEDIELNLQPTNWANYTDYLTGTFQLPAALQLSHGDNTLGIYFKAISSSGTDGAKYSYQINGLGNLWSTPSTNDFVSFVRLPPGKYVFKVKAKLPGARWSEPAIFSFEIKKAFWQTWWFYMLTAIIFLGFVYILFQYRLQQKVKLLEMRNRISQDLHDEIGASMSGINLLSQMAAEKLEQNKTAEAADYLFKVKNYTQDVIEKLSDMVWIFNPQNDSIEKLLQRLRSFFISIGISKNIKLTFETDKLTDSINHITLRQRKAIYLISKEALNNCFKYSGCSNIYYRLGPSGSKWLLQIEDDGIGFTISEDTSGNGLKNMQARASEIGAKLNIQSQPGNGTIITMEF